MTKKTIPELIEEARMHQYDECPVIDIPSFAYRPSTSEQEIRQSEDRMHQVCVLLYKIEVLDAAGGKDGRAYTVHATSALDARCIAFVLDGGCAAGLTCFDDEHIELAITYTRVVE